MLTAEERSERARLAAHVRWSKTVDRKAAVSAMLDAVRDEVVAEVDPDGEN